jgi:hypothetical protein
MAITEQAISATLLKINGTTVPGIKSYKVGYNHLWKDADRNMSGSVRASLIGIFPKIEAVTRDVISRTEIQAIYTALESQPYFSVQFWDPATDSVKTANYYTADWSVELESKNRGLYKGTTITLVPVDRRA